MVPDGLLALNHVRKMLKICALVGLFFERATRWCYHTEKLRCLSTAGDENRELPAIHQLCARDTWSPKWYLEVAAT